MGRQKVFKIMLVMEPVLQVAGSREEAMRRVQEAIDRDAPIHWTRVIDAHLHRTFPDGEKIWRVILAPKRIGAIRAFSFKDGREKAAERYRFLKQDLYVCL